MNVLVVGGSGFLGSHTADALTEAGYKVKIFDIIKSPYLQKDQEMIVGNILDKKAIEKAPVYQRGEVRKQYVGLRVCWKGDLLSARAAAGGKIDVALSGQKTGWAIISFSVSEKDYPELKVMAGDSEIEVKGEIFNVEQSRFDLKKVELSY